MNSFCTILGLKLHFGQAEDSLAQRIEQKSCSILNVYVQYNLKKRWNCVDRLCDIIIHWLSVRIMIFSKQGKISRRFWLLSSNFLSVFFSLISCVYKYYFSGAEKNVVNWTSRNTDNERKDRSYKIWHSLKPEESNDDWMKAKQESASSCY